MSWLRIDDNFVEHPKIADLSDRAFRLHMAGLCFCARNLTDGLLTVRSIKVVCALTSASRKQIVELRDKDLWLETEYGYVIKDYLSYNADAKTVKRRLKEAAERQRQWRERNASLPDDSNALHNASRNAAPSHPIPSHIQSKGLSGPGHLRSVSDAG